MSVIIPAKNEAESLPDLLRGLGKALPDAREIIVVDDGSTDSTKTVCAEFGVRVVSHPYPKGNGAAIKSGARAASGEILLFMDADGQHRPQDVGGLLEKIGQGYDMAVGARETRGHAGLHREIANRIYNRLASWMVNHEVRDLTSGFRAVRAENFRRFLSLLPNAFSYPTTITMSFFRAGFSVAYVPVVMPPRVGRSHIHPVRDGVRFLLIIIKIGTLYSPLKLFLPVSALFFVAGFGYYLFSYITIQRFTNMAALLLIASILTFLIGIVSEQISALMYKDTEHQDGDR